MVRFFRLTASVVMVVSGAWLAITFVSGPGKEPVAAQHTSSPAEKPEATPARSSRLIPDAAVPAPNEQTEAVGAETAAAADELAPLADVLVATGEVATGEVAAPTPLPAVPAALAEQAPPLEPAYQSALDLPPPPLLDAQAPPPLVGGSTWRQPHASTSLPPGLAESPAATARSTAAAVPSVSSYVVRDGDDLTSIASRFYGHPAAARLVYEANRDRLPAADVLPIGAILVLPPPPSQSGREYRPGGWIEPAAGERPSG